MVHRFQCQGLQWDLRYAHLVYKRNHLSSCQRCLFLVFKFLKWLENTSLRWISLKCIEQILYECEKSRHTARSRHGIEEIISTNHIAREHFSSNQNARTRHCHGHGTARPYRNFSVVRNLLNSNLTLMQRLGYVSRWRERGWGGSL
jgi:hypothetical protein